MCRAHLPLDPLPFVRTVSAERSLGGTDTIPFQASLERPKPVGRSAINVLAMGVWGCRISRATGSLRDWLTWAAR